MPETCLIPDLLKQAPAAASSTPSPLPDRPAAMPRSATPVAEVPTGLSLPQLAEAAQDCRACRLCEVGTQVVFGEGPVDARLVFVGEQPGDQEDQQGRPFVGPAGQLLNDLLGEAGIERDTVYVTNAVKHFSHEMRGKLRLHKKPTVAEQRACQPWLHAELDRLRPAVLVCLGATAAQNVLGRTFRLTRNLGTTHATAWSDTVLATYHPSAILRMQTHQPEAAVTQRQQLRDDLVRAREAMSAAA
jgi:DNA polymerase